MKVILRSFINGVLTIVPIILVVYVVYKSFMFLDSILRECVKTLFKRGLHSRNWFTSHACTYHDSRVDVYQIFNRNGYSFA